MIEAVYRAVDKVQPGTAYHTAPYTLFGEVVPDYFTVRNEGEQEARFLAYCHSAAPDACLWPLSSDSRPPGHGMMLAYNVAHHRPKTAIDLGCGKLLFLGRLIKHLGAEQVVGVDIAPPAKGSDALAVKGLTYVQADMFSDDLADNLPISTFDLAVTHPPMMPSPPNLSQTDHDFAGPTGREVLDKLIDRAPALLNPGGRLLIGQFNFLGVEQPMGEQACTAEKLQRTGMIIDEVHTYRVPASQAIIDGLGQISQLYPGYEFQEENGRLYHHFSVVGARLSDISA